MKQQLSDALRASRADYTEIRLERSWSSTVALRGRRIEGAQTAFDCGGFVRCLNRGCGWGAATFTGFDDLSAMVARAHELSLAVRLEQPIRLAEIPLRQDDVREDLDGDARGIPLDQKVALLVGLNNEMLAVDRRIVETQAAYRDEVTEWWYGNSDGILLHELRPEITLSAVAVAREGDIIERGLESLGLRRGWLSVHGREGMFRQAAERAVDLLKAPRAPGGRYPVVLDPRLAGVFIHESIGHLSEADFLAENPAARTLMKLGRRVGPDDLNVGDDGSASGRRGTLPYDDEGTPTRNTTLIQNGVVVGRLHNRETAARAGEPPTGNARALSFRYPPIVRLTNTYIANGRGSFDDLIRDIKLGIYACDATGGRSHLEDFSLTSGYAHMIRNGKVAEMVKPVTLAGKLFETLERIERIGGDFRWNEMGGGCGKNGQVPLAVSEGAPHVRLSEILVGGDAR